MINSFQAHSNAINRIKQSPYNNDYVATCSLDKTVKIWNISNPSDWCLIRTYTGHTNQVFGLEWINENTIASGGYDNTIKIWSINTGETNRTITIFSPVRILIFLTNSFYIASGLYSGNINIYDINNGNFKTPTLKGQTSVNNDLIQINNDLLASSSYENFFLIWNLTTNSIQFNLTGHTSDVFGLKLISSDVLASGSNDKTLKLWNITNGQLIRTLTGHSNNIYWSIDILSNSQTLVSGSLDQTIKMWNLTTGLCLNSFTTGLQTRTLTILNSIKKSSKNIFFLSLNMSYVQISFYSDWLYFIFIYFILFKQNTKT